MAHAAPEAAPDPQPEQEQKAFKEAKKATDRAQQALDQGQYARAELLYQQALAVLEAALGPSDVRLVDLLQKLALARQKQGQYERAEQLYSRALAIQEAASGKNHPVVAGALIHLAALYSLQEFDARAAPLVERAIKILEGGRGEEQIEIEDQLADLTNSYTNRERYEQAERLYHRLLAIREAAFGENHPSVTEPLENIAQFYEGQGLFARAEPLYLRILTIQETAFGLKDSRVAPILFKLAFLYREQGLPERAEPLHQRMLVIAAAASNKERNALTHALMNFVGLTALAELNPRAEPLLEPALRRLSGRRDKLPADRESQLEFLANAYKLKGSYTIAEWQYQHLLEIREAALGKNHPLVASTLGMLADVYRLQKRYAEARPLHERALAIREAASPKNPLATASTLEKLAEFYMDLGLYPQAEPFYKRALSLREGALGENHPTVILALDNLAKVRVAQLRIDEALPLLARILTASETRLRQDVFGFSEERLAGAMRVLSEDEEPFYMLVKLFPDNARLRQLALAAALLRKGRSIHELANTSRIIHRGLGSADREVFERLRELRTRLAELSMVGPDPGDLDYLKRVKELTDQGDALEVELARRSAPLRALYALPPVRELTGRVAAALPKDAALIQFVTYPIVSAPRSNPHLSAPQKKGTGYLALLLFADGSTRAVNLGSAEDIDLVALRMQRALAIQSVSYEEVAQELYTRAFQPLVPHLGKVKRLLVAPEGQLNLIPFAALHDGKGFLIDTWDFTYLTSGKDLLARPQGGPPARSMVVIADPDFAASPVAAAGEAQASPAPMELIPDLKSAFSSLRAELADENWPPLPGTRREAEAIQRLFPRTQLLLGEAATKQALLGLPTPGILHIATHGFFRDDAGTTTKARAVKFCCALAKTPRLPSSADPLLRSGLVLVGARAENDSDTPENSWVTALELAGLNLWGTQLVVLSACDTGRGDIQPGQGVYGLRRAFLSAGAETVVTSLWQVKDDTTSELMEGYYQRLFSGRGRTAALREAMQALRQKHPHPHFWAPFIAIGRDTPLRGMLARVPSSQ
ncbi:MAG TPA: CHAT domain-containing tetratricopeptide repeat protein [Hyalangium sp.]|nr:CHAT domain-containing tetratricopeptide repeat protein [Hyalangium sp.]